MPIYMDRHDVSDSVTAENVAQLHQEDLKIQDKFNCRGLTYWFDDIKKIAFCLVDAPDKESIHNMHHKAHGEVPNQIIEVDATLVESFLGRIKDPVAAKQGDLNIITDPAQRTLVLIRFKPLSLASRSVSETELHMQSIVVALGNLLKPFEGRLVEQYDGYLLIVFKTILQAVSFAYDMKEKLSALIHDALHSRTSLKIGIATGMPVSKEKAFFEDTIKLANALTYSCLEDILVSCEANQTFLTENSGNTHWKNKLHRLTPSDENFLIKLMEFIETAWQNPAITVEDFGHSLGMSKTIMYRKMLKLTGKSPSYFLKGYRLNQALEALNRTAKTISEIAFETGFNSTSYFSKCFQKQFGMLPSEHKNSQMQTKL